MAKRSEALQIIMDHLQTCGRIDEVAYTLLDALESFGMLPPLSNEVMSSEPLHVTDSILESVSHDFKWEDEDGSRK